jgi:arylsulfatase A-like enzyme
MGYRTRNIDRVASEGVRFTDYYGEQSCTAGRAAFITGQNPYRTGLTKVGLPGAPLGLQPQDPTIAKALKAQGYATGLVGIASQPFWLSWRDEAGKLISHAPDGAVNDARLR